MKINDFVAGAQEKIKDVFTSKSAVAEDEKALNELAGDMRAMTEEEKKERVKMMRQRGFQIASRNDTNIYTVLNAEKLQLREDMQHAAEQHARRYRGFIERLGRRRKHLEEQINKIKAREAKQEKELEEHVERKKQLRKEIEDLKLELVKIREKLSESKKTMGERLVTDAEIELNKVVALQKKIYGEVKTLNVDRFNNTQPARAELITKWKELRTLYQERLLMLAQKTKLLGGEGINSTTAYVLICLGSALAGVSGYFFAIFSVKAKYSSNDVFYYLLKNIIEAAKDEQITTVVKISFFIGALAVVTVVSWWADRQGKRNNNFIDDGKSDLFQHSFKTGFNIENTSYNYETKDKSWFSFWLKVLPLLLVTGCVILMLSTGKEIKESTNDLSASTEGLLIGTAIAMGLAAAVHVYITKITESRPAATGLTGHIKRNWELVTGLGILIASVVAFVFFTDTGARMFSIIGFLGTCLGTAFSFAYGLRFWGLCNLADETENQLLEIDRAIARNSVPVQPELDLSLNRYFKELGTGLYNYLKRKNEAGTTRGKEQRVLVTDDPPGRNKKKVTNIHIWGDKKKDFEDSALFEMMEWEYEYFPEQAEQLKVTGGIFREKKAELQQTEEAIERGKAEIELKRPAFREETDKVLAETDRVDALEEKAGKNILQQEEALKEQLRKDLFYVEDGFELGLWYRKHGEGPAQFPFLLNDKN